MLSSLEMVSEPSGKTKTLADMIKDGIILTPETPVHTSDDSMDLEEYVEAIAKESGGVGAWELVVEIENLEPGHNYDVPQDLTTLLNGIYTDVCIVTHTHENTTGLIYADDFLMIPFDVFKAYLLSENFIHFDCFGSPDSGVPQQTAPYGFRLQTVNDVLKLWYFGAQHITSNSVLLDIKIYAR